MDALIDRASGTPLTGPAVRALASATSPAEIREAIGPALRTRGPHAATVLAFALAAASQPLPREVVLELLPDLPSIEYLAPLVGVSEGDRVALLLDLVEGARASWEREALALYLATQLLDGQAPPPRLVARLRSLARQSLSPEASALVGLAAIALDDPGLKSLAAPYLPIGDAPGLAEFAEKLRAPLFAPAIDALPEREPPRVVAGYTLVRPGPKVGRNDPCPCGSGRKYKKCCEGKDPGPGSQSLVDQLEALDERHERARDQLFELLRPADLARLNPERLTTLQLIRGMRRLLQHRRWDVAERFIELIKSRSDVPGGLEHAHEYHDEIADQALAAGELAVAERHFEQARPEERDREDFRLRLALARRDPEALALLDTRILRLLREDDLSGVIDCAHELLDHVPALGIAMARGCITPDRPLDSEMLLDEIERVRDRLGLAPDEPWWEVYDQLLASAEPPDGQENGADQRERERLAKEVERLRGQLRDAARDKDRLDDELQKRVRELQRLTAERERLVGQHGREPQADHEARVGELAAERQRLRAKIEELKGEIAAGATQRADLRSELARLSAVRSAATPPAPPAADDGEPDAADAGDVAVAAPRSVLIPNYAAAAAKALAMLPRQTAAQTLHAIAALAAGEPRTWRSIKRMRATEDVYSARVGRDYRVLFRIRDPQLDVLDIVDRKDLDAALNRVAR
jgi:mRNA-degrading endonuclease RelE of RelBE toxin-antitoxin system